MAGSGGSSRSGGGGVGSDGSDRRRLQLRALLANWYEVAVLVCLLVAAVGGATAYSAHLDPGTETVQRTTAEWTTDGEYDHSARVTEPNPLFEEGVVVSNRGTYLTRITPELEGSYRFGYEAPTGNATVSLSSTLVIESTDGDTTYWQRSRSLASFERAGVGPGRTLRLPFSVNVSAVVDEVKRIESALGGSPGEVTARIQTTATYTGVVDGEEVRRSRTDSLLVTPGPATYGVEVAEGSGGEQGATATTTETVERSYGPTSRLGGPAALLLALALAGLLLALDPDSLALSAQERAYLTYVGDRAQYEEWLSRLSPSAAALERPGDEAESLADLVEYAIDGDRGVLAEPGSDPERFHVVADDGRYVFEAPAAPEPRSVRALLRESVASRLGEESAADGGEAVTRGDDADADTDTDTDADR